MASDPDREHIQFLGSKTLPSTCNILSDKSSIPFYSTSNGYNNKGCFLKKLKNLFLSRQPIYPKRF